MSQLGHSVPCSLLHTAWLCAVELGGGPASLLSALSHPPLGQVLCAQGGRGDPADSVTCKLRTGAYSGSRGPPMDVFLCLFQDTILEDARCQSCSRMVPGGALRCSLSVTWGSGISAPTPRRHCCVSRQVTPGALGLQPCLLTGNRRSSLGLVEGCSAVSCLGYAQRDPHVSAWPQASLWRELLTEHALGFCPEPVAGPSQRRAKIALLSLAESHLSSPKGGFGRGWEGDLEGISNRRWEPELATYSSVLVWKFNGQRSLVSCGSWNHKVTQQHAHLNRMETLSFAISLNFLSCS